MTRSSPFASALSARRSPLSSLGCTHSTQSVQQQRHSPVHPVHTDSDSIRSAQSLHHDHSHSSRSNRDHPSNRISPPARISHSSPPWARINLVMAMTIPPSIRANDPHSMHSGRTDGRQSSRCCSRRSLPAQEDSRADSRLERLHPHPLLLHQPAVAATMLPLQVASWLRAV